MITKEQAISLTYRTTLHHVTAKNSDGTPQRCRVNGACKVWKTRPAEFSLPVKAGLYGHGYVTHTNAHEWSVEA